MTRKTSFQEFGRHSFLSDRSLKKSYFEHGSIHKKSPLYESFVNPTPLLSVKFHSFCAPSLLSLFWVYGKPVKRLCPNVWHPTAVLRELGVGRGWCQISDRKRGLLTVPTYRDGERRNSPRGKGLGNGVSSTIGPCSPGKTLLSRLEAREHPFLLNNFWLFRFSRIPFMRNLLIIF